MLRRHRRHAFRLARAETEAPMERSKVPSMKPMFLHVSVSVLAPLASAFQAPEWSRTFDGPASFDDQGIDVATDATGDVVVVGNAWVEPQPGYFVPQIATLRYSPQGQLLWSALYGSGYYGGNGNGTNVRIAPNGNVIVAGARDLGRDWVVLSYTPSGSVAWTQIWAANSYYVSEPADLEVDSAGNVYLCGDFGDPSSFQSRAALVKLDSAGAIQWVRVYDGQGSSPESVSDLAIGAAGELYLTGYRSTPNASLEFSVFKVDPSGAPVWLRDHGLPSTSSVDYGRRIEVSATGVVVACGVLGSNTPQGRGIGTIAYDVDGTQLWRHDHGLANVDEVPVSLALDASGVAVIGAVVDATGSDADGFVLKVAGGQLAWTHTIAGTSYLDDRVAAARVDSLGRVLVVGERIDTGESEWFLEVLASDGSPLGGTTWSGPFGTASRAASFAIGAGGTATIVGTSAGGATGEDIVTAEFAYAGISTYCTAGTSAVGCVGAISGTGTPSSSAGSGFTIRVSGIDGQRQGLVFYGITGHMAQPWGTGSSYLCVKSPTQRTPTQSSGGTVLTCDGLLSLDWNAFIAATPGALGFPFSTGTIVTAQGWYRDPPSPKSTSLSDALEFAVAP
jgi:hypothetical protein